MKTSKMSARALGGGLAQGAVALAAAWWGWGFGQRIGGAPMGVLAALNCAVMAALLLDAAIDRLSALRTRP